MIEPALGGTRLLLAVLCDAYNEEVVTEAGQGPEDTRVVLKLHEDIAPYKLAVREPHLICVPACPPVCCNLSDDCVLQVLPLMNKGPLTEYATNLHRALLQTYRSDFDTSGSIGKRYRRHDEIGTPFCVTVDFDTVKDNTVTVRCRDSMKQVRVSVDDLTSKVVNRKNLGLASE